MTTINFDDVQRFLTFLDPNSDKEVFNYAIFNAETSDVLQGCGILFGTIGDIEHQLTSFSPDAGFTLHVTLNRTSINGRKNKDIESCRVVCVDIDREVPDEYIKQAVELYKPQLVVRSSPGKYHLYWRLDSIKVSLDQWSDLQTAAGWAFKADMNLPSLGHLIRVPGVARITKSGEEFMPVIVYQIDPAEIIAYTYETFLQLLPGAEDAVIAAKLERAEKRESVRKRLAEKGSDSHAGVLTHESLAALAFEENRNETLFTVVKNAVFLHEPLQDVPDPFFALMVAEGFNDALKLSNTKGALDVEEMKNTAASAYQTAIEARAKKLGRRKAKEAKVQEIQQVAAVNGNGSHGMFEAFEYDYALDELGISRFSEEALVERVLQKYGKRIVRSEGNLYVFSEAKKIWVPQTRKDTSMLRALISECINDMVSEEEFAVTYANTKDGIDPNKLSGAINGWKTGRRSSSLMGLLKDSKKIPTYDESPFDRDIYKLLCSNGVVDLLSGEFREATAGDYLVRRSKAPFDPNAGCEWWISFLKEVFRDNHDPIAVINFLQEVFGYSLTGNIEEQTIFIHFGGGANGKSRVLSALATICGNYVGRLQPDCMGSKKNGIAKVMERISVKADSRRVLMIDDLETGLEWNEGLVKSLTERTLIGRNLFEEERDIVNRVKLHISCNEIPKVQNSSHAVYRRLAILEYPRKFDVDPVKHREIDEGIQEEAAGILNWAIEGLKRIRARENGRIEYPQEVRYSLEEYEESNSTLERVLLKAIAIEPESPESKWTPLQEIYDWLKESAEFPFAELERLGLSGLGALLRKVGCAKRRVRIEGAEKVTQYGARILKTERAAAKFG